MSDPGDTTSNPGDDTATGGDPTSAFECERVPYPCTLAETPIAVLDRSEALADSVADMIDEGASTTAAATWLEERDEVEDVRRSDSALRFRIAGGRPTWVWHPDELGQVEGASSSGDRPSARSSVTGGSSPSRIVVGEPTTKSALALSPFRWQFGVRDDGRQVADLLEATRGYANRVVYKEGADTFDLGVTVEDFKNWNEFDVVHVITPGTYICEGDDDCNGVLIVRQKSQEVSPDDCDDRGLELAECDCVLKRGLELAECETRGLEIVTVRDKIPNLGEVVREKYVAVGADFFTETYENGLGDVLLFMNGCRAISPFGTDLTQALRGALTTILGWDELVSNPGASQVAEPFYRELIDHGATASGAWKSLGDLRTDPYSLNAELLYRARAAGGDHRIREIVWIERPGEGEPLSQGDAVLALGNLGDGVPDTLEYRIRVDGVEGSPEPYGLQIEVDGIQIDHPEVIDGTPVDDRTWIVREKAPLERDLNAGDQVEIHAHVLLPDQGRSEQTLTVEITAPPPAEWAGSATHVLSSAIFGATVVQTHASDLVFERVADPTWPPGSQSYEVASGRLTWSTEGEVYKSAGETCPYSAGPMTFDVVPGSAHIEIDPNVASGPSRYNMYGSFEAGSITINTSCPGLDFTTTIQASWLAVFSDEDRRLSPDGNKIAGDKQNNTNAWTWSFTKQEIQNEQ